MIIRFYTFESRKSKIVDNIHEHDNTTTFGHENRKTKTIIIIIVVMEFTHRDGRVWEL